MMGLGKRMMGDERRLGLEGMWIPFYTMREML
jgi:hypothetical protein